jgi:hypothetical protein
MVCKVKTFPSSKRKNKLKCSKRKELIEGILGDRKSLTLN